MRLPYSLTLLLVAATSVTCRHVSSRHDFKHGLLARVLPGEGEEGRPGRRPDSPRPYGFEGDQGRPPVQEQMQYRQTLAQAPQYGWAHDDHEFSQAAIIEESEERDIYGRPITRVTWPENGGNVQSTRVLQSLQRGGDGIRYLTPREPTDNEIQAHLANEEAAAAAARSRYNQGDGNNQMPHSYYTESPLDRMENSFIALSRAQAQGNVDSRSRLSATWSTRGNPGTVSYVAGRPNSQDGPPSVNMDENGNVSPVVDEHGRVYDVSDSFNPNPRRRRRDSVLTQIENNANSPNSTLSDQSAQFQAYLHAYYTASANISAVLFPYLDSLLQSTNSSLAYNMAFSLYADLTGVPVHVTSPFSNGLNCIDWIEEAWRNSTNNGTTITVTTPANSTVHHATNTTVKGDDVPMLEWLAAAKTLRLTYDQVWANVTVAANQSLQDLATLSRWMTPSDKAVLPSGYGDTVKLTRQDMAYFSPVNQTTGSKR